MKPTQSLTHAHQTLQDQVWRSVLEQVNWRVQTQAHRGLRRDVLRTRANIKNLTWAQIRGPRVQQDTDSQDFWMTRHEDPNLPY